MDLYRSPYEAYPFLCDPAEDLRCDFELHTDAMASRTGLLRAQVEDEELRAQLSWICALIYHMNPTLRTTLTVTGAEVEELAAVTRALRERWGHRCRCFVLPQGTEAACTAHLLRVEGKALVRLLYRHVRQGHPVPDALLDLANLLSGYFFFLALGLNARAGEEETAYQSRNYL